MSQEQRRKRHAAHTGPDTRRRGVALVIVIAAAVALVWISWRPSPVASVPAPAEPEGRSPAPAERAEAGESQAGTFDRLLGEWVRPDGGYVLSVRSVATDGTASVGYFNPRPIRVARAEARRAEGHIGLFVELQDVNYPGSTYTLAYDAQSDHLRGVYFQAVQGARYGVVFRRNR